MLRTLFFVFAPFVFIALSCTKEKTITSKNAFLITSDTILHFDTVFTSVGSITQQLKIFNINNQTLRISNVQLMGGSNSFFKMNVSGTPGTQFSNIDVDAGDSLYVFVSVNINPTSQQLPFIIQDSIRIDFNGNTQFVKLDAFGQNAHFLRSAILTQNTTWTNNLPYVLLDTFAVAKGATLTIEKGTKIYCGANTPFTVEGSLQVNGTNDSTGAVTFLNNRLDAPYSLQPGTWKGIYFTSQSTNNVLTFAIIKNALQGIAADEKSSVVLNECKIDNCAEQGIAAYNCNLTATNCLLTNCNYNLYCIAGGNYAFINCTLAAYSTQYLFHQYPAVTISNTDENGVKTNPLQALFQNCIVYGENGQVSDEVATFKNNAASFTVNFENTLYRSPAPNSSVSYTSCLMNVDPTFKNIDLTNNVFDFHLGASSPCINAGKKTAVVIDLDGNLRSEIPDIGCYEFH